MTDPLDLEVARVRAQADQLRSTARDALREMERGELCDLFRTCAKGDLSGLDERTVSIVAWLALVAMLDLGESPAGKEGDEAVPSNPDTPPLDEAYAVEDGFLVRRVVPKRGVPYQHRCPLAAFEAVAHTIDEMGGAGFGLKELGGRTQLPWTQVNVALAFMKERGCVVPVYGRRHKAATGGVHLDAMIEWHALAEGG